MNETTIIIEILAGICISMCVIFNHIERTTSKKANRIAKYLVDTGTNSTITGNYVFTYSEINEIFRVNLPKDRNLLIEILYILYDRYGTAIAELDWDSLWSTGFDFIFYLDYCPNLED